ncbi:ATP-dependent helicase [Elizabethkingia meningoseptica]|uniref:ATP-dependent helicase n=1 Tax=Elizabethkingia meningoseptica TaxID=238 RepID=UPI0020129FBE|nr:ATP-dependent DNA helicase [Elizabethkingia meningoseptica]MCL1675174.1 ATP-dependent helicase [Elizabethkingia meningoseptica]MCL1685458.1 ATP-dependent helicase [Elizabethkingia meningoseptica]
MGKMIDLNDFSENQQEAIITNDKHLRIIACAGSGKTTTVAGKVAYLLDPENGFNIKPENIIAFTYTEKAAGELKNKILNKVDRYRGMANMYIGTIHGWCLKSLQENEYKYQSFSVLDDIKLKLFVDKYYDVIGMKEVTKLSNPTVNLRRFIDTSLFVKIMDIVRESESRDGVEFPNNILSAKKKYQETLISKKYFDFSMIMEKALECLKDDTNLAKSIKANLKYLIVDEYQDVNPLQEKLINRLQEISNCKLIVVGDDDQNIYQWRGSNNKYIIDFESKFGKDEVKTIPLSVNYRSSEGITKLSETLISNNQKRIREKKMESFKTQDFERGNDILYNRYSDIQEENEAVAQYIDDILGVKFNEDNEERGITFSDVAILLRTWNKASSIVQALEKHNIPYITAGVNQLFEMEEIQAALAIFNYLYGDIDKFELKDKWLSVPNIKVSPDKIDYAISRLSEKDPNLENVKKNWEYSLQDIFWNFLNDSEVYEENFVNDTSEELEFRTKERAEIIFFNLGKFSQVINDFETINFNSTSPSFHLFSFLSFITYVAKDYYPEGWLNNPYKTPNAVQIMTIHQSKGLEFPCVIVPGLNHNYLPAKKRGGLNEWHFLDRALIDEQSRYEGDDDKEDERRLLYVALTRSQKYLLLTQAPDLNNKLYKKESIFISELISAKINQFPIMISDLKHKFIDSDKIDQKPKEKVKNISLDFTSLKDIFECPYRFKLISVFGFCYPLNQRMGVGRSFHNCLMEIHKEAKKGVRLSEEELKTLIDRQTHFPYLTKSTKLSQPLYDKVRTNVEGYYRENESEFKNIEFVEQEIQYKIDKNILIVGRIDLIKKIGDAGYYETTIVEFKSDEENADAPITKDQLKLYALGHRELTGETANYIMTYVIGKNQSKTPEKLYDDDLEQIQQKIKDAVSLIRDEEFVKTDESKICIDNCFQIRLCSNRIKYNIKPKR